MWFSLSGMIGKRGLVVFPKAGCTLTSGMNKWLVVNGTRLMLVSACENKCRQMQCVDLLAVLK